MTSEGFAEAVYGCVFQATLDAWDVDTENIGRSKVTQRNTLVHSFLS